MEKKDLSKIGRVVLPEKNIEETQEIELTVKDLIISMLAASQRGPEIRKIVKQHTGRDINRALISYYNVKYRADVDELRDKFMDNLMKLVPIANIVNRAMTRQRLVDSVMRHLWNKKPLLNSLGVVVGYEWRGNHAVVNKILDSQAMEMQGFELNKQRNKLMDFLKESGDTADNFIIFGQKQT